MKGKHVYIGIASVYVAGNLCDANHCRDYHENGNDNHSTKYKNKIETCYGNLHN